MAELSFGEVFNMPAIDINSIVNMVHCPEVVASLEQTVSDWKSQDANGSLGALGITNGQSPIVAFIDNYGDREFAYITGNAHLKVYTIDTTGGTITLASNTTLSVPTGTFYWAGIKKVGSSYYIYYTSTADAIYGSPSYMKFGRLTVVPDVSCTNTVLQNWSLPTSYYFFVADVKIIGRTAYVAWLREYTVPYEFWHLDVHIYSLDMETEACSGGAVYQTPGSINVGPIGYVPPSAAVFGINLKFAESLGSLTWCMAYKWTDYPSGINSGTCVVIGGSDNEIGNIGGNHFLITAYQYNSRDYLFVADLYNSGNLNRIKIPNGVLGSIVYNPTETLIVPITFHSQSVFPAIGYSSGFTFIDPATGLATSAVSISGVDTIYAIFPTLDSYSGNIFMLVSIGGAQKIISTDSAGGIINKTYDITFPISSGIYDAFNHGNFFTVWSAFSGAVYVTYVINLIISTNANVCQMIIEQN
jgi:hypothetical protein